MYQRNAFAKNIVGIDHVSYLLANEEVPLWYGYLNGLLNMNLRWSLPHITLAYSETAISELKNIHWDTSVFYNLYKNDILTIDNSNECYLDEITDPQGDNHLVIAFKNYPKITNLFNHYLSIGATWNIDRLGEYFPFIFISKSIGSGSILTGNPRPIQLDRDWHFSVKRYSRFSESRP